MSEVDGRLEPIIEGPAAITANLFDATGNLMARSISGPRRSAGVPVPFWVFNVELGAPGIYTLVVEGGPPEGLAVQVFDRSKVLVPLVGDLLPPLDTPTTDDPRGVDPVCTREPACPFHSTSLAAALTMGKPTAFLIGTPAYCQTGVCGPVLDNLIAAKTRLGDAVTMVHAEVYTDESIKTPAPTVLEYQLDYEPALFITDSKGRLVERLDGVWDTDEMNAALDKALAAPK